MRHQIAAACALGFVTLAFAQAPQSRVTTYDARALLRAFPKTELPHRLPLHAAFAGGAVARDEGRVLDEDQLIEFLRSAANDPGTEIEVTAGQVFVKGPPSAHQAVAATMDMLARTLLQEVTVLVYAIGPNADVTTGVLTAAEADRVLSAKAPPVELARTVVLLGQPGRLRAGKGTSFVSDYDVEVAQSAAISDPVIRVLQEGLDFQASVGGAADGRLSLKFGCTRCALAEALAARTVSSTRLGDIQLPKVRSTVIAGSGLVEDGGALVARHDGGLGAGTLVRVRRTKPAPASTPGVEHHVLFADDLLGRPLRVTVPTVRDDQLKSGELSSDPEEQWEAPEAGALTHEVLQSLVRASIADDGESQIEIIGSRVHLRGPEAKAQKAREALAELAKGLSRNLVVDFRIGKIDGAGPVLPAHADELVPRLATVVSVPISLSDQFLVAGGLEQSAIIDQDVEIAQQAQIADPIVAPLFSGYVISGVASAAGSDRIELVLDVQHQEVLPWPGAGFPSRAENVGPVDLPQIDATFARQKLLLEPGRWTVVSATNPSESSALVILARVR